MSMEDLEGFLNVVLEDQELQYAISQVQPFDDFVNIVINLGEENNPPFSFTREEVIEKFENEARIRNTPEQEIERLKESTDESIGQQVINILNDETLAYG